MSTATLTIEKKKTLVPQLRFQGFGGEWKQKRLGEIAKITTGSTPSTLIVEYYNGEKLFVSPADIQENRYVFKTKTTLTENGFSKGRKIAKGSVLFVCIGSTIGKVAQATEECLTNQQINALYATKEYDNNFIYELLEKNGAKIKLLAGVQAVPQINKTDFSNFKYFIPALPEQQKIASFLSVVDEKIQQLSRKKELLTQYKKGVMQQLFSGKLRFKDENGEDYADWGEKKLGALTYKVGKKNKENIKYPIYSINNKEGFLPQSEQFDGLDSNDRGYDISLYKIVNSETFAYNPARINVGSIGYSYNLDEVIVSSLYVCFKTKDSLEDLFLLAYLGTYTFKKDILRFEEGGVRQYLFYENFSMIKIPLPSNIEQKKIAKFLSSIDAKIESINQQINQTQTFKKGLLQQMFV
ncbi:restriction endonuclease subunit S [Flavobacterium sp. K5-23]|uniref:restriction endonuclease subunit S n=1 Tax=Flavobacterium sp. K5-23 TaxID=2746225 RepID=UPI00200C7EA7|nr:restriction endonuclease subunit S [Flavobacterium sp. K5-23]UQD57092.1 restriction endonuclease subunit S [Flavobacterium sp. K5-23]